jgi:putative tryptophan/tyrosine transport system substrate-binding protein
MLGRQVMRMPPWPTSLTCGAWRPTRNMKFSIGWLAAVIVLLLAAPIVADAQQTKLTPKIGVLLREGTPFAIAVRDGLRELGYVEHQNVTIEWRGGGSKGYLDVAEELVRLNVDIIVAGNNPAIEAARKATRTIPIVMAIGLDPVQSGFVASLARPGSNITGLSLQFPDVAAKRVQILKEVLPNLSALAILWDPGLIGMHSAVDETERAARTYGARVQVLEVRKRAELDAAFAMMTAGGAQALVIWGSDVLIGQRARITELAMKRRLPTMCPFREYVEAGCLMSYAPHIPDLFRRTAYFVNRILKGAKPADLPIEQPTKFELVVNLKTATALGLAFPASVLVRADQVIQ